MSVCEIVQQPIVFIGEVVEGGVEPWENPWYTKSTYVRLKVKESLHGMAPGTQFFDMTTIPPDGMCAPNVFHRGRTYLVAPRFFQGKYWADGCASDRDVEQFADEVDYVRQFFGGKRRPVVRVFVGSEGNFYRGLGAPGAKISTTRGGAFYSAVTNDKGVGWLEFPGSGSFDLTAMLLPYRGAKVTVPAPKTGCTEAIVHLASGNTVSGRLNGPGRVGLISLDVPVDREGGPRVVEPKTMQEDGTFQFGNVPLGRYLLKSNPDGPGMGSYRQEPRESTYYPGVSDRGLAKVLDLRSTNVVLGGMDFAAGPKVQLRDIWVMARYRDGRLMSTGQFRAIAVANRPGTEDAFVSGVVNEMYPEFRHRMLPVDRRIRIELWDEYRPWLKKYVAEFPPGVSKIEHTFVTEFQ